MYTILYIYISSRLCKYCIFKRHQYQLCKLVQSLNRNLLNIVNSEYLVILLFSCNTSTCVRPKINSLWRRMCKS